MISLTVQARFLMSNGTKMYQVSHNDTQYNLTMGDECNPDTFASTYNKTKATCLFGKYEENPLLLYFQIFHLFGWLWGSQFLVAFAECSLAGAFASYYWTRDKSKVVFQMFSYCLCPWHFAESAVKNAIVIAWSVIVIAWSVIVIAWTVLDL